MRTYCSLLLLGLSCIPVHAQTSCAGGAETHYGGTLLTQNKGRFTGEITQSSGLALDPAGGTFWTHNDQGNATTKLYNFTPSTGSNPITINSEVHVNATNLDWEDMTKDNMGNVYVGQTGHNCNQFSPPSCPTKHIYEVHRYPFTALVNGATLTPERFYFKLPLSGYQTNNCNANDTVFMNCESLIYLNNELYFISKDQWSKSTNNCGGWSSSNCNLFKAPLTIGSSAANPIIMQYVSSLQVELEPGEQYSHRKMLAASISPDGQTVAMNSTIRIWFLRNFSGGDLFNGSATWYDMKDGIGNMIGRGFEGSEWENNNTLWLGVDGNNGRINAFDVPSEGAVLDLKALLLGPFDSGTQLMADDLRQASYLPTTEPYTALGYSYTGSPALTLPDLDILTVSGNDAIVDWVVVELRDVANPANVQHSMPALLRRDGKIVAPDGCSPLFFSEAAGTYHIALRHRNHLGVMTAGTYTLNELTTTIDLSLPATATYGTDARNISGGNALLWSGDVTFDGIIRYTGNNNDRDPILVAVGGNDPTATSSGYSQTDMNMDGISKYIGSDNDRDPILVNVGGSIPTSTRQQQLP